MNKTSPRGKDPDRMQCDSKSPLSRETDAPETIYNCDLSASYNIGARYFIRELLKPLPATERSLLEAKVLPVKRRTSCVYADLRKLHSEMELLKAA